MGKKRQLFCFLFMLFISLSLFGACNKTQEPNEKHQGSEIEKKLIGKWRFLYTDAVKEIPPKDMAYIFKQDHTSTLEYTDPNNNKKRIEGTYEIDDDFIQFYKNGKVSKRFKIKFEDKDTLRLTETESKNSMVLERVKEYDY